MSLTADSIFTLLAKATFGVYAISRDQTIVYWNGAAERILGYTREQIVGRPCAELLAETTADAPGENCQLGCPSIEALQAGRLPSPSQLRMISASGEPKVISLTPIILGGSDGEPHMVVQLFTEAVAETVPGAPVADGQVSTAGPALDAASGSPRLTKREMEVLRLVSAGWDTPRIANELNISPHTVLNHIRHFRRKLDAPTKLDAVVTGIRLGILPIE